MEGANESTELQWHPIEIFVFMKSLLCRKYETQLLEAREE